MMKTDKDGNPKVKTLEKRLFFMREQQEKIVPVWREISKYVSPNRGAFDFDEPNQGQRRDRRLVDATPSRALGVLQAGMQGGLTSPSRTWFKLQVSDPELASIPSVMRWTDEVRDRMSNVLGQSNIYNCLHGIYGEIGAFGIGALFIEDDPRDIVRGKLMTAGEYFVAFDSRDMPNAFGRILWMTAGQMRERFGEDRLSDSVKQAINNDNPEKWFKVHHIIVEDSDHETRFPFMSVYWEPGRETELGLGGYEEFPVLVPRWETIASDYYGYGPGWLALSESKTLQELRRDYLIAQKKAIDPPLMAPEGAVTRKISAEPGAVNYTTGVTPFQALYQVNLDIPGQLTAIMSSQQMINQIFYSDLFLMIASMDVGKMTATEAQIRYEERMQMLGPVTERLEHELLDPLIARVFNIMNRHGMFPPLPEELAGQNVTIEYVSMLAIAQKSSGLSELNNLMTIIGGLAQMNPEVIDKLAVDEVVDQYVRLSNIPAVMIRSDEEVAELREARAAAQQQAQQLAEAQQTAAALKQGTGAIKDLATAPAQEGSVMDAMFSK
jgi:hypothetical protein